MNWADWLLVVIVLIAFAGLIREVRSQRTARQERRLDFSKCYHNQPHEFEVDVECCGNIPRKEETCGFCGRPYSDVIHKTK